MKKLKIPYPLLLALSVISTIAIANETGTVPQGEELEQPAKFQLTTAEIQENFSDVRDDAEVQDSVGSVAINYWYANGQFTSNWSNAEASGTVEGRWRAFDDKRCVTILAGLPDRTDQESCAPIYRRGNQFLSTNPDGSIHGVHTLSPLTGSAAGRQ